MRRSDLDRVRDGMIAVVRLDPDTARIHDRLSIRELRYARYVRVAAENQRRRARLRPAFNVAQRRRNQLAVTDVFEKTCDIALGRRMTEENVVGRPQRRRQL